MPASDRRPHPTEVLLCAHHYRASKLALAAAGATVLRMNGDRVASSDGLGADLVVLASQRDLGLYRNQPRFRQPHSADRAR